MNLVSRSEAKQAGLARYFTGAPCIRGHISVRYTTDTRCVDCARCRARKQYIRDGSNIKNRARNWGKNNRMQANTSRRAYRHTNKETELAKARQRLGLPSPLYPAPPQCELCQKLPNKRALCLDHNHETGKFRGWLCDNCNTGIGKLGDTVEGLERAIAYLKRQ